MELTNTQEILVDKTDLLSGPLHVAVDVTNKCNARCLHCYNRSGGILERNEMSDEALLHLYSEISEMKPYSSCFCGGEPMLRYPILLKAAELLKGAGVATVAMVSNGWFITAEKAECLVGAGLTNIQISLDGATSETHEKMRQVPGLYERALGALQIFDDLNIPMQVAFSPTNFNIEEFPELCDALSHFNGLTEVRVQPLMPMGVAMTSIESIFPDDASYRKLVRWINSAKNSKKYKFRIEWGDPLDHLVRFPSIGFKSNTYLDIKSNGDIAPSAYLPIVVGNVLLHSLKEYWEAGIGKVWSIPVVQELASHVASIGDMRFDDESVPRTFFDENIEIDFIDDSVAEKYKDFTLDSLMNRTEK